MSGKGGEVVGRCQACRAEVRESYCERRHGRRDGRDVVFLVHTAIRRRFAGDPGKPCGGGIKPYPRKPQQFSVDAWRT